MSAWTWIGVAVLGGVGASMRFLVHWLIERRALGGFPVATLVINSSGSLLLGLLSGLAVEGNLLVLTGTATLGAYTTFSTWMLESHRLAEGGRRGAALANVLLSLAVGICAVALGRAIGGGL